jgi:hypothetical protein
MPNNAQEYLDQNYPLNERKNITKLDLNGVNKFDSEKLTGCLDLSTFTNLVELACS